MKKRIVYLEEKISAQFRAASEYTWGELTLTTLIFAMLAGVTGGVFLKVWNMDNSRVQFLSYGLLTFCGTIAGISAFILVACTAGCWLKIRKNPLTKRTTPETSPE